MTEDRTAFIRNAFGRTDAFKDIAKPAQKTKPRKIDDDPPPRPSPRGRRGHPRFEPAIVNDALDIKALAEGYGAEFMREGTIYKACCILPDHVEETPSFAVYPRTNHFYCYGCGQGGDPLRLIQLYKGWLGRRDFPKVLREGAAIAGVAPLEGEDAAAAADAKQRIAARRREQQTLIDNERRAKEEKAKARWLKARPIEPDTIHYDYLWQRRGVDLSALDHWPNAIRVFDDFRWNLGTPDDPDWRAFPVICTAMTRAGAIAATHLTFLLPDGSDCDRSVGQKGRIVLGSPRGASMHLSRGRSGLPPRQAFDKYGMDDCLALAEGLEDALSVAMLMPDWRVWAAYSLDNIANAEIPDCAGELVVCGENDTSTGARATLERVKQKLLARAGGRLVKIAMPPEGCKDWNAVHEVRD